MAPPPDRFDRLDRVLTAHLPGEATAAAWGVAIDGAVHVGSAGTPPDTIFRISSMTKPVTAVAALILVEECRLRLDDPVDDLLPELADRVVLRDPAGPLGDTVPAERSITVEDVLTFRLGYGMDFEHWDRPQASLARVTELGLGDGPPRPSGPPAPDEWIRRLGTVPLAAQPGERWLYHTGADVAGVLVARAAGQPFDVFVRERILDPLGMVDTGFHVPADQRHRFGPAWTAAAGASTLFDPVDGEWASAPAFPSGGGGLVSTVGDYLAFATMLLAGGTAGGERILSPASVEAMTRVHVEHGPTPDGTVGWGLCVGVQRRAAGIGRAAGSYGWDGGLGSSWSNDPARRTAAVLLTDRAWSSPVAPAIARDLHTCVAAAAS